MTRPKRLLTVGDVLSTVIGEVLCTLVVTPLEIRGRIDDWMARWDEKHASALGGDGDE